MDKDKEAEDKEAELAAAEEAKQAKRLELIAAGLDDEEAGKKANKVVDGMKKAKKGKTQD